MPGLEKSQQWHPVRVTSNRGRKNSDYREARILQIIPTLDQAGAEKQMGLLARGLPRDEFDVHVCALTRGGPLSAGLVEAGIPTTVIGKRWKLDPRAFWQLKRHVATLRPDLVHTWIFAANAYGRAAASACGVQRLVLGLRCVDPWKGGSQLAVDRYARPAHVAGSWPTARASRSSTSARGCRPSEIEVIPNGVAAGRAEPPRRGASCWPNWNCPREAGWWARSAGSGRRSG